MTAFDEYLRREMDRIWAELELKAKQKAKQKDWRNCDRRYQRRIRRNKRHGILLYGENS